MVEGPQLIAEACAAGWEIEAEFVNADADAISDSPVFQLDIGVLQRIASTDTPQPNLAVVRMRPPSVDLSACDFVLFADQLSDPGNLGTLLRSSEAAGLDAVVLSSGSVDSYNPKVVRASAGALFHIPVITATMATVGESGLRLIGSSSHRGERHDKVDWSDRLAIVLGNEAHGLPDDTPVDDWVRIEHKGRAESLNVAMAGTILLFEAVRQRA